MQIATAASQANAVERGKPWVAKYWDSSDVPLTNTPAGRTILSGVTACENLAPNNMSMNTSENTPTTSATRSANPIRIVM